MSRRPVTIELSGVKELIADLRQAGIAADGAVEAIVEEVTEGTAQLARQSIEPGQASSAPGSPPHSKTGRLLRSIAVVIKGGKVFVGLAGTAELHGRFLEFGTARMAPRPWLLPAFKEATARIGARMKAEFERRL